MQRSPLRFMTATLLLAAICSLELPISHLSAPVAQAQTLTPQKPEEEKWFLEAYELFIKSDYPATLAKLEQDLARFRQAGDRAREGAALACIGRVSIEIGQTSQALDYLQKALVLLREVGQLPNAEQRFVARTWEGITLGFTGLAYSTLGRYPEALDHLQQALAINREVGDRFWQGITLNNIGLVYTNLAQYRKAIEAFQQALAIYVEVGNRSEQGTTLTNIGLVYSSQGQYPKALESYQQALTIFRTVGSRAGEGSVLNNIGLTYSELGQYAKALEYHQQALTMRRLVGDYAGEGVSLANLGTVSNYLKQPSKALEYYQQALVIVRKVGDRVSEGTILSNIGWLYSDQKQYPQALEANQQALSIRRQVGDRAGEGLSLNNIGTVYHYVGRYPQALEFYQQALAILREVGDRATEGKNLSNIAILLETQRQPELAIVFYKQSVNVTEAIRGELRVLPTEQQQVYTETISSTYRRLANLLLQQDRVLEAQRVLDLLKVQELGDYLSNVRGNEQTEAGIEYLPAEQQLLTQYNAKLTQIVQLGQELDTLQQIPANQRTLQQQQRKQEIEAEQQALTRDYLDFTRSPQIASLVQQLSRTTGGENLNPALLRSLQDNLKKLSSDAVLLYPLILEDRLELVLVTPYAPPIRRPVPVKREELNRVIAEFRLALNDPTADAQKPAQQLYTWLIQPVEAVLQQANAQTIIYAPDGQLRYIPLAALHDGKEWLVQKYRVNNITALSLTEWNQSPRPPHVLAGAFSQGNYRVTVGDRTFHFNGLPFAGKEVETLVATLPDTTKLLNQAFSKDEILARISDYSILHFATHAAFVPGEPEESFIVFGNGDTANFRDVELWNLTNTDLVVLSACETGLGSQSLGDGREILGFGYLMQQAGAKAAIASLWQVDDGGTQVLMNAFYQALEQGMTKAEALRQAQIALITQDLSLVGGQRGVAWVQVGSGRTGLPATVSNHLSHPYYWAPFILIGNGL